MQSAIIPDGVESVGSYAFQDCTGLQTVTFPNSIRTADCFVFYNCTSLNNPVYNNCLFAYLPRSYKGSYVMLNTIREVCCGALMNCDSLTAITLADSLTRIGSQSFYGCRSLHSVIIPDEVTTVESYAFTNCQHLLSIGFPANLQFLGEAVLSGCTNLKHITWNAKDAHLSWIFYDQNNYPYEILVADNYFESYHPFYNARKQILSFTFGDSVRVVPRYLCYGMENLTSLSFGCEVDSIEFRVFDGCSSVSSINWNARNYKDPIIYTEAPFYSLRDSITSFSFGDSVRHIPAYICHSMSGLHEVRIPKNVSSIGNYAFRYLGILDSISVDPANTYYDSRGGCNALMETATNLLMLGCYKTKIPTNTQGIDAYAFRKVRNFTTANLPESVSFIGKEAFNGCVELKSLTLPRKLGAINDYSFQDCDSLYSVFLPDSLWYVGLRAFSNCSHLQSITIPEGIELIDQYSFSGCNNLQSITCMALTPPAIQETSFRGTSCPIYVPCPSITAYRTAPVWTNYGTRVAGLYSHTLTVKPNDYSYGRVTVLQQPDCEHTAILEADPIFGHKFVSWQDTLGNVLSLDTRYEFYLDEDKSLIAEFVRDLSALDDVESHVRVWVNEHDVMLLTELNTPARLYDLMGHEVDAAAVEAGVETALHAPGAGIYVIVTDNDKQKVIIK